MRLILFWLALLACHSGQTAPSVAVAWQTPPPFGYGVGSVIRHQAELFVPAPWQLDIAQLPTPGQLNHWLEIRDIAYEQRQEKGGVRYQLWIDYQIFPALQQASVLEIPSLPVTLITSGKQQSVFLPAWSFTANPLIPPQWSNAQVEIRPLWQPQAVDLTPHWQRLSGIGVGLLLVGLTLAWRYLPHQQRPFARALPKIRRAVRTGQVETAFLAFHQALNETLGQALFAEQLAEFLHHRPAFAPLQDALRQFFDISQKFFYSCQQDLDPAWLIELERLCRACIKAERRCRK